jgi:hypothetical protein
MTLNLSGVKRRSVMKYIIHDVWLPNVELHNLYASQNIIREIKSRKMRWACHVACMGEMRNAYSILVGKPEGKSPLGRIKSRW